MHIFLTAFFAIIVCFIVAFTISDSIFRFLEKAGYRFEKIIRIRGFWLTFSLLLSLTIFSFILHHLYFT